MTSALYISTGVALYGAAQSLHRATRVAPARVAAQILFALLCLSVAGFTAGSAWLQSAPAVFMPLIGKVVIACGLLSWFTLTWLVAVLFERPRNVLLIALSVAWPGLLLLNLGAPVSLVYFNFAEVSTPFPGIDLLARVSQAWWLVHTVILVSWGYMLWHTRLYARSTQSAALTGWWVALYILGGATGIDLLINAGLLASTYLSPFAWTLLLMLMVGLLQESAGERTVPLDQPESGGKSREQAAPALAQSNHNRIYLPVTDPDSALHFHWHLDPIGQSRTPLSQDAQVQLSDAGQIIAASAPIPEAQPDVAVPAANESPPQPLETDLAAIVQFTRIALRRIDRGKTDAKKFATLFRAIQQKAEAARDTLVTIPAGENLASLVANVLLQADAVLQANDIRVVQRLAKNLPATGVDQVILEQVLSELLHEAIEATLAAPREQRKPIILIGRATRDAGIELSITDGGAETSLIEIQNTFESLLAERATESDAPLLAAAELIAAQNGRLWCVPNPAGGTIRYLRLPGTTV
ncbi:MAG: hypothetical protein KKA36_03435 [Gammaproteobacteria bacterium]|nr:hypothetical protein [Gammaproteobacteria bacterium]MBU2478117.1 hypothetical protein [Gammaproteobacteria bacterium]